ncbi:MAG: BsaA family SipW-dependent biofilm matrix protein [Candidatus Saccharibacteria bacterium]|nr:BsaA family SipW-dependent biofilm matrix protein [Candidatus Saccharibacteria bacterium]
MKNLKNKKTLVIAGLAVAILGIAGTIAYNQDSMHFNNAFTLGEDKAEYVETFESPDNWTPCDVTPKSVIATNKGTGNRYVRVKFDYYWRKANSTIPESDHITSDLDNTWKDEDDNTESYATVILDDTGDWEKDGEWYYYKKAIAENESTTSPIKSVNFNCEANTVADIVYSDDGLTATSVPSEYASAKFHVYVTIQMSKDNWR